MASSNVSDLLKRKAEKEKAKAEREAEASQEEGTFAVEVEATGMPERPARVGDIVVLTWGDPTLIGSPTIEIPLIVTLADAQSGRVNGQMVCDPTMQGADQRGRPVQMPSVVPVANVPYALEPRPLTWRHREA